MKLTAHDYEVIQLVAKRIDKVLICKACGDKGWVVAPLIFNGLRILRCDTCKIFDSDREAIEVVSNMADLHLVMEQWELSQVRDKNNDILAH